MALLMFVKTVFLTLLDSKHTPAFTVAAAVATHDFVKLCLLITPSAASQE